MELLTTSQCAEILRYHPRAVNKAILDGNLKAQKLGRDWIIRVEDLHAFIKTHPRPTRLAHIDQSKLRRAAAAANKITRAFGLEESK